MVLVLNIFCRKSVMTISSIRLLFIAFWGQFLVRFHAAAFGGRKGEEIANLVNDLLVDSTALPLLSIVAIVF